MASSGTISLNLQSIDNYAVVGQLCWPDARLTRGHITYNPTFNWSVNDSGVLSVSFNQQSTYWYVCAVSSPYYLKVQFSENGSTGWTDILTASRWNTTCVSSYTVNHLIRDLAADLGTVTLTRSGYIRIYTYVASACPDWTGQYYPADEGYPNAYPTEAASQAVSVPVHIDVNWDATLKYNSNGGTPTPATQTHSTPEATTSWNFTVSSTVPTRSNYRFDGWKLGSTIYHGGDTVTIQKSAPTQTLVAQWTEFYRPGERKVSGTWSSHNRSGGACERKVSGTWTEMRTIDGGTGTGDEPTRKSSGTWYNQRKLGAE